jgi:spore coat polysaccharide biosynthesis protein SpsF
MKSAVLITVRSGSTRLPGKALIPIYRDVPILEHIINRAKRSKLADKIIVCTTLLEEDDKISKIAEKCRVHVFRGSVEDKLDRWKNAVDKYQIEYFATMDGDDPLCVPELIDKSLKQIISEDVDFIESAEVITGLFTYAIKSSALKKVCELKDSSKTEMMWTYFKDTGLFKMQQLKDIPVKLKRNDIRLTLDYPEDLELFKIIFTKISGEENIDIERVIDLLNDNFEIRNINFHRQSDFLANQKANTILKLK